MDHCPVMQGIATGGEGVTKTHGKTTMYVTGPATAKVGVLAFPDIFGFETGRSKVDAESVGALGYAVVLVDVVGGDYLDPSKPYDVPAWIKKHPYDTDILLHIQDAVEYLKTEAQVEQLTSFGYCFGAWVGAKYSADPASGVLGNVSFHPSWTIENLLHGEGAVEEFAEEVKAPQLLLLSGDEPVIMRENGAVHEILKKRGDISNVVDFPQMKHGFVNRGDIDGDEATKDAVMHAWHLAVKFLQTAAPLG